MTDLVELPAGYVLKSETVPWTLVAPVESVPFDRGIAVLVERHPVALFRLSPLGDAPEEWHAVDHIDPHNLVPVMARGLVGSYTNGQVSGNTISSPLDKRRYDLRTGRCLDAESAPLRIFEVIVADEMVLVR